MTSIDRVGTTAPRRPMAAGTAARSDSASFTPPADAAGDSAAAAPTALSGPVTLDSLLALQQVDDATVQDRTARDHGRRLLGLLGGLQGALLAGADSAAMLAGLRDLTDAAPPAADPALAAALAQVVLRARIELARRRG